jgi:pSer/pThr/pTyr-binding forkhead associated (FHA) protein
MKVPVLTIVENAGEIGMTIARYVINQPETTIGRSPECDIQVGCEFMSKLHARVRFALNGGIARLDQCGRNGIDVSGLQVVDGVILYSGDRIIFSQNVTGFYSMEAGESLTSPSTSIPVKYL